MYLLILFVILVAIAVELVSVHKHVTAANEIKAILHRLEGVEPDPASVRVTVPPPRAK